MVVAVCGKFDEKELFRTIKKTFGRLRRRPVPPSETKAPESKNYSRIAVLKKRKGITSSYLVFGYLTPGFNHPDAPKLILLNSILCDGLSSKLYLKLIQSRGLGYRLKGDVENLGDFSVFHFDVQIGNPNRFLEAKRLILEEIKKIRNAPLEDIEGYKSWLISQLKRDLADIDYRSEMSLDSEIENWSFDFRRLPEIINKITAQEIQEASQKYLTDDYTLVALVPWGFRIRRKHRE
jgi:predicted Zn-dependent peptidase